jgi:preprotein translocase SecE subunit
VEKASIAERTGQYAREVRAETRRIVWPGLRLTAVYTAVVLVTVGVLALLIYVADLVFGTLLSHV